MRFGAIIYKKAVGFEKVGKTRTIFICACKLGFNLLSRPMVVSRGGTVRLTEVVTRAGPDNRIEVVMWALAVRRTDTWACADRRTDTWAWADRGTITWARANRGTDTIVLRLF